MDIYTAKTILKSLKLDTKQSQALDFLINSAESKDCFNIPNVNFSICKLSDRRWETFKEQRIKQGFDETECWNLDATICKFIIPRLQYFKDHTICYPEDLTFEKWLDVIDKMIDFFKKYANDERYDREGLELFVKYFPDLWW